jgi:hypothetical protein
VIWLIILGYVNYKDLGRVGQVSQKFCSLSRNPSAWKVLKINLPLVDPEHLDAIIERCPTLRSLTICYDKAEFVWDMTRRLLEKRGPGLNKLQFETPHDGLDGWYFDHGDEEKEFYKTLERYCLNLTDLSMYVVSIHCCFPTAFLTRFLNLKKL